MPEQSPKVGYKNPPVRTRFQKGHSGNPKGRPKGKDVSLKDVVRRELEEKVSVSVNGRIRRISKVEYFVKKLVEQSVKHPGFCKQLIALIDKYSLSVSRPPSPEEIENMSPEEAIRIYDALLKE